MYYTKCTIATMVVVSVIERKGLGTAVSMLPTMNSPFPMAIITMNLIKDLRFLFSLTKLMCFS